MTLPLVEACWSAMQVGDVQALTTGLEAIKAHLPEVSFHVIIHWVVPMAFKCETPDILDFLAHYDSGFSYICYVNLSHLDMYLPPIIGKLAAGWPEQRILAIVQHLVDHRRSTIVYPPGINPLAMHEDEIVISLDYLWRAIVDAYKFARDPEAFQREVIREIPPNGRSAIDAKHIIGRINSGFGDLVVKSVAIAATNDQLMKIIDRLMPAVTAKDMGYTAQIASRYMSICIRAFGARGNFLILPFISTNGPIETLIASHNGSVLSCSHYWYDPQIICKYAVEQPGKVVLTQDFAREPTRTQLLAMTPINILRTLLSREFIATEVADALQADLSTHAITPLDMEQMIFDMCDYLGSFISLEQSADREALHASLERIANICRILHIDAQKIDEMHDHLLDHNQGDEHEGEQLLREIIATH